MCTVGMVLVNIFIAYKDDTSTVTRVGYDVE